MKATIHRSRWALLLAAVALTAASCSGTDATDSGLRTEGPFAGTVPAAEFPRGLDWFNTGGRSLAMSELTGKIVALHFWSPSCISCVHVLPDVKRLGAEFADELFVIGVHAPRFPAEAVPGAAQRSVLSAAIDHPVVNDPDLAISEQWGVEAQPTVAIVDPAGNVVGARTGEGVYEALRPVVASLVEEFAGSLDVVERALPLLRDGLPKTVLSFPAGVAVDVAQRRAFIADTGNHRIVLVALPSGDVLAVYGSGTAAFADGPVAQAEFSSPRGLALSLDESKLYVADTGNHAIRVVDVAGGDVTTLAGNGTLGAWPPTGGTGDSASLRSPWDVADDGETLFVAMAGSHQLWTIDLESGRAEPLAGSGAEDIADGPAGEAALTRPSSLVVGDKSLYFTDPESSSLRRFELATATVSTLAGSSRGLFVSGDVDGTGAQARFQFPVGLAWDGGRLVVADTYNNKVKAVTADSGAAMTLAGSAAGWRDGTDPQFNAPAAIEVVGSTLYVADTNNHALRIVDLDTGETSTLVLRGIEVFQPTADDDDYRGTLVELEPVEVAAGAGAIVIDITLPAAHKVNDDAPSSITWAVEGGVATFPEGSEPSLTGATFPVSYPVSFHEGTGNVTADLDLFWCAEDAQSLCFIEQLRFQVPVMVGGGGNAEVTFPYEIQLPEVEP